MLKRVLLAGMIGLLLIISTEYSFAGINAAWTKTITLDSPKVTSHESYSFLRNRKEVPSRNWFGEAHSGWRKNLVLGVDQADPKAGPGGEGKAEFKYTVSLSPVLFAWGKYNRNNQFIGYRGVSWGLGFYSKNYFNPPRKHAWNGFWQWGTFYLLLPFIGVGTEYTTENVYFEVATFYIIPYLSLGVHF